MNWEDKAAKAAEECLSLGFAVYDFQVTYPNGDPLIRVFIDKLSDPFGSPTIAECEQFSQIFGVRLMSLTEQGELPERYSLEVSSPGAERELRIPGDFERFAGKPVRVLYHSEEGKPGDAIVQFIGLENGVAQFKWADVKKNRKQGKAPFQEIGIPLSRIDRVNLHLDF